MTLTRNQVVAITARPYSRIAPELVTALNAALARYHIHTPLRVAHFMAQVCHESGGFRYMEELASGEAYEGRRDLGNTLPGDGKRYKGRGVIQITGRTNYSMYSRTAGVDFVAYPELLARLPWSVDSAGWFWYTRGLGALADKDDLRGITRRINGGYNGFSDRQKYLYRSKNVLGVQPV